MSLKNLTIEKPTNDQVDLAEKGRNEAGETISLNRRLFMQLLAFTDVFDVDELIAKLTAVDLKGTLYWDVNDPYGIGLVTYSEDPTYFVTELRQLLNSEPFVDLTPRPELTMHGRTYSIGYEADLERTLISRPIERLSDPELPWAVWYPLRRSGEFETLSAQEQRVILMEHGGIGQAYGRAGLAYDVRLASYGLGSEDNDFTVALLGKDLVVLSQVVQRMRKTKQTSVYLEKLGPFFVGKVAWQNK